MFFTWIVNDVFHVTETYESALYTIQATFVTLLIVLIPVNLSLYRSRKKELEILSTAIHKVSEGDYSCRIATDEKSSLTPIYEDFNKMCGELESVQILRNDFINNYSHEFKTPITSINGFASLLLESGSCRRRSGGNIWKLLWRNPPVSQLATNTILLSRLNNAVKYTPEGGSRSFFPNQGMDFPGRYFPRKAGTWPGAFHLQKNRRALRLHHSCRERTGKGQLLYGDAAGKVSAGSKRMHIFRNTAYPLQTGKRGKCA